MSTNPARQRLIRKKRLEQKRRKTKRFLFITLGIILLISLAAVLPNLLRSKLNYKDSAGFTLGNPDAPIKVVNFSSFYCGYCASFSMTDEPEFIKKYVDTGDVYYRYVNLAFSSDEGTQNAAKVAYCVADQNLFFELKPNLYSATGNQDGFSITNLTRLAESVGVEREEFDACLTNNDALNERLAEDILFAQSVGVTGTPSFLVNDQLVYSNQLVPLVESLLGR
ncbi:MAG TPA: thioredoxin domain-containing protein [Brevefilum sp.]|nr:thioredoxin domain-containing protein [Brevefilum sp.]HPL69774.1 thioredoxin domain-containing protein [Brevefilum sp.]